MKLRLLLSFLLLSMTAWAAISEKQLTNDHCNALQTPGPVTGSRATFYHPLFHDVHEGLGEFFLQRKRGQGSFFYQLTTPWGKVRLQNQVDMIFDFVVAEDRVWTVGSEGLKEFDLGGGLVRSYTYQGLDRTPSTQARGVSYHQDLKKLYVSAGKLGLISFDLSSRRFDGQFPISAQLGSWAVASAQNEDLLFVVMSASSAKGFSGIVVFDTAANRVLSTAGYNTKEAGSVATSSKIYVRGDKTYLNNGGWVHELTTQKIMSESKLSVSWKPIQYTPAIGYKQFIRFEGDFIFVGNSIMGCASYHLFNRSLGMGQDISKAFTLKL